MWIYEWIYNNTDKDEVYYFLEDEMLINTKLDSNCADVDLITLNLFSYNYIEANSFLAGFAKLYIIKSNWN